MQTFVSDAAVAVNVQGVENKRCYELNEEEINKIREEVGKYTTEADLVRRAGTAMACLFACYLCEIQKADADADGRYCSRAVIITAAVCTECVAVRGCRGGAQGAVVCSAAWERDVACAACCCTCQGLVMCIDGQLLHYLRDGCN
jgi:hypothetical protein